MATPGDSVRRRNAAYRKGFNDAIEAAALAVNDHNREGREWVKGSLWDEITKEASARIRALEPTVNPSSTDSL